MARKLSNLRLKESDSSNVFWALYGLEHVLEDKVPQESVLLKLVSQLLEVSPSFKNSYNLEQYSLLFNPYLTDASLRAKI